MITTIEKAIFLQDIDVFEFVSSHDLSYIAKIAEEIHCEEGEILYKEGDISDSMWLLVDGEVHFARGGKVVLEIKGCEAFGTWSLFDEEPRVVSATCACASTFLVIEREKFIELLHENIWILQSVLKALAGKMRSIVENT